MLEKKKLLRGGFVALLLLVGSVSAKASESSGSSAPKIDFKKVIITLDGGGVRGLFQALFFQFLEDRVRDITKIDGLKIGECIDFVAGTSTGSITGGMLSFPDPDNPSKPLYSANEFVDFFNENINKVFPSSLWRTVTSGAGVFNEKYSDEGFTELLEQLFNETPLKNACTPALFTAFELSNQGRGSRPYLFRSHPTYSKETDLTPISCTETKDKDLSNATFSQAIRSSGAAPTYFERSQIDGESGQQYYFVDGGVSGANNPASLGYTWGKQYFEDTCGEEKIKKKDYFCLSMGTGKAPLNMDGDVSKGYGLLRWAPHLIPIMLDAPSMLTEDTMLGIFPVRKYPDNYRRFQPELEQDIDLADTSEEALKNMRTIAQQYISDNDESFEHTAQVLAARYRAKNPEDDLD